MIANARENLSDEQLKHVTGGARGNSRPEPAGDHLIDYCNLHGAATFDEHHPPGPAPLIEKIQFSGPVTVQDLQDESGHAVTIDWIDVYSNGDVWAVHDLPGQPGQFEAFRLGDDEWGGVGAEASQTIINDAVAQGDQVSVTGFQDLPVSLPNNG